MIEPSGLNIIKIFFVYLLIQNIKLECFSLEEDRNILPSKKTLAFTHKSGLQQKCFVALVLVEKDCAKKNNFDEFSSEGRLVSMI